MGTFNDLPEELSLELLEFFELPGLISAYRVDRRWRSLVTHIHSPLRLEFFNLAFHEASSHPNNYPVSIDVRQRFVKHVEDRVGCSLPDDFRFVLTEWPVRCPPPGYHWPHSLRFFADGFCSCNRRENQDYMCLCEQATTSGCALVVEGPLRDEIRRCGKDFDPHADVDADDSRWDLFMNPPRLFLPEHTAQTVRFILAHDNMEWSSTRWMHLKTLRLSPYYAVCFTDGERAAGTGEYYLILDGPCRGQIHAWKPGSWYDGFEAENFLEWRYEEMSKAGFSNRAPPLLSSSPA